MIPARKSPLLSAWFGRHAEGRLSRTFSRVRVRGTGELMEVLTRRPVLVVANHESWWDSLFAIWLGHRALRFDGYAMMDADNLRRLPFLGRVGGFGVERGRGEEALRYAAALLDRPGRLVWMYPQGAERPAGVRPLGFRRGAAVIAAHADCAVVPLAVRYRFGARPRPEAWLSFGPAVPGHPDLETSRGLQEAAVQGELDRIHGALTGDAGDEFPALLARRRPLLERVAEVALARLTRLPEPPSAETASS